VRDTLETTHQAVAKLLNYRIIPDHQDKLNLSILDIQGELLLVSQFTLLADTSKGLRPNFSKAAKSPQAEYLFNQLVTKIGESGLHVETGQFGAKMQVSLTNSGPVTIILDN
jgi:D-tyrosyl-tRNA(Tyr) deacylase